MCCENCFDSAGGRDLEVEHLYARLEVLERERDMKVGVQLTRDEARAVLESLDGDFESAFWDALKEKFRRAVERAESVEPEQKEVQP